MRIAPRILHSDDVYRIGVWQNMTIADVAGDLDAQRMRRMAQIHLELASAHPAGIVSCTVVRTGIPKSSAESREVSKKFLAELGDVLKRSAVLLEETGLMVQVLRTFVRGLNVVTRNSTLVLCANLNEVAAQLAPFVVSPLPGSNCRPEILAAIAQVRQGYNPQPVLQAEHP